jgi:hypothetical protein
MAFGGNRAALTATLAERAFGWTATIALFRLEAAVGGLCCPGLVRVNYPSRR